MPGTPDTVGLDTTMADVIPGLAENADESPQTRSIELFLSIPQNTSPQDYAGGLRLRLRSSESVVADTTVTTRATVVAGGLAADAAVAEILPHTVTAGATHQEFSAYLLPTFGTGTTGINRVRISLPSGFSDSNVLEVRVGGTSVPFASNPSAGYVVVGLPRVWTSESVQIRFTTTVTTTATAAAMFPVFYDDTTTAGPEQVATEGDANRFADGDNWQVHVVPGPLARLDVSPKTATLTVGETRQFTASGSDGFGNHVPTSVGWRAESGMGTIDSSGFFSATAAGSGIVVAETGAVADTAFVTVNERPVEMTASPIDPRAPRRWSRCHSKAPALAPAPKPSATRAGHRSVSVWPRAATWP